MSEPSSPDMEPRSQTPRHGVARHLGGFATSGAIAFMVDATVLTILTRGFGVDPFVARLAAISVAMVAGWRAHRRLTFNVKTPATFAEFLTYAAVAWTSAAVNYAAYAAVLVLRPGTDPLVALVAASLVAMTFSYLGMRFGVFRKPEQN